MIQRFLLYVFLLALWLTVALRRKFHSWWRCRIPSCGRSCWRHCSLGSNTESFRKQVSLAAHFQVEGFSAISWKMRISKCSIDSFWKKNWIWIKITLGNQESSHLLQFRLKNLVLLLYRRWCCCRSGGCGRRSSDCDWTRDQWSLAGLCNSEARLVSWLPFCQLCF